jgi:GT2 family glycosyltransferase
MMEGSDEVGGRSLLNDRPSITAVVATRNRVALLREALDSIYAQEGAGKQFDVEVIVVDDASTDDTPGVVARYPNARCIRLPVNRGQSVARNIGFNSGSGKYVAFLDDDDVWLPEKLSRQVAALEADPAAGVAYSQFIIASGDQRSIFPDKSAPSGNLFRRLLFVNLCGIPAGPLVRREAMRKVGGFNEDILTVEDYDLWLRLSFHFPFVFVPGAVAVYRRSDEGNMLSFLRDGKYENAFRQTVERALALLPDTEASATLKQQVRANCELRLADYLSEPNIAWDRLYAGLTMWPSLALNSVNRSAIAHIIADRAADSDSPIDAATRMWREIRDLQRTPARRDQAEMRRLLAAAYWQVGVTQGKGIGRPANPRDAASAILRSLVLDPFAVSHWRPLLEFLGRRSFGFRTQ